MERVTHRAPRSAWVVTSLLFAVVLAFTAIAFVVGLAWWYRLGFTLFSALFLYAFVELRTRRVTLGPAEMTIVSGCRRRTIPASEMESVTWGADVGVSVRRVDGTWVGLPEVGSSSQGLTNSVRAWLKRNGETNR